MANKENLQKEKKGELTTQQIVILIILIVSFIIILLFIFLLKPGNIADKEICHNSVVMRGNSILPTDIVPIDCKTKYICISKDGSCEKMTKPEIVKVKEKEEVYEILAENMADCWWMFGEGKIDYVGKDMIPGRYCSICTQIAFDDSIVEVFGSGSIDKKEFYNYLASTEISDSGLTYLEYLNAASKVFDIHQGEFGEMDLNSHYYVLMGIDSKIDFKAWGAIGAGVLAFALVAAPFTGPTLVSLSAVLYVGAGAGAGAVAGHYIGNIVQGSSGNNYLAPTIIEANYQQFNSLNCSSIKTLA